MLIEKFTMLWQADTARASADVDSLRTKSEDSAKKTSKAFKESFEDVGKKAKEASDDVKKAAGEMADASERMKKAKAEKQTKQESDNINGLKDAQKKTETNAGRWEKIVTGLKAAFSQQGSQKILETAAGGVGGGASAGGSMMLGLAEKLPGIGSGITSLAGLSALGAGAAAAAVVVGTFAMTIAAANKYAEDGLTARKRAWEMGLDQFNMNKQMVVGRKMGLSDEETGASLRGIFARVKEAGTQPYGEAALRFRQAGIKVGVGGRSRDVEAITQDIIKHTRELAKAKGQTEAIAWATQRMGMSFEMAEKYATATDAQMKSYNQDVRQQAADLTVGQLMSKQYAIAQRDVGNSMDMAGRHMSGFVTPALTRFSEKLADSANRTDGVISAIGKMSAAIIDFATNALGWLDRLSAYAGDIFGQHWTVEQQREVEQMNGFEAYLHANKEKYGLQNATDDQIKGKAQVDVSLLHSDRYQDPVQLQALRDFMNANQKAHDEGKVTSFATGNEKISQTFDAGNKQIAAADMTPEKREETSAEWDKIRQQMQEGSLTADKANEMLQSLLEVNKKQLSVSQAQLKNSMPPIPVQPVTIGLEQALSLWASGIGKAAQLKAPEQAQPANERADFERVARAQINAKRDITYNPNTLVSQEQSQRLWDSKKGTSAAVGQINVQSDAPVVVNTATKEAVTTNNTSRTIERNTTNNSRVSTTSEKTVEKAAKDSAKPSYNIPAALQSPASKVAQQEKAAAYQHYVNFDPSVVAQNIQQPVASDVKNIASAATTPAHGGITFNQENNYNVTVEANKNVGQAVGRQIQQVNDQAARALVNSSTTSWRN